MLPCSVLAFLPSLGLTSYLFNIFIVLFMYKYLLACVPMHHIHVWCPQRLEQGGRTPELASSVLYILLALRRALNPPELEL